MDKLRMSRVVFYALLALALNPSMTVNASDSPATTGAATEELYKIDFPPPFVDAALKKQKISQDKVDKIISTLQAKHEYIHAKAKEIGATEDVRNPFDYPPLEEKIVHIFHRVLFDVYASVMKSNGIQDEKIIEDSFEYIQQQKIKDYVEHQRNENAAKGSH